MHDLKRAAALPAEIPSAYAKHSQGYRRVTLADHTNGSVHMGVGLPRLEAGGALNTHFHAYEEAFFILAGQVVLTLDAHSYRLGPNDYGIIPAGVPHAWYALNDGPAQWYEMLAPQPKPADGIRDTFFIRAGAPPTDGTAPDFADPRTRYLGHFTDAQMPPSGKMQMDGDHAGNIHGISLKMLIDRTLGAQHLTLFMVEFQPGGEGVPHEHPFEESYYFLSGAAEGLLDGATEQVATGDFVWTGVGGAHGFFNRGTVPVRWIETQSPQPPAQQAFHFYQEWDYLRTKYDILDE